MVLSNKKLKEKLRAELTESLTKSVAGSNPINDYTTSPDPDMQNQNSLRKLLDSATQKRPRLSKREKRRKVVSLQGPEAVEKGDDSDSMEGDKEDDETKEGGSKGLGCEEIKEKEEKKKLNKKGKSEQEKGADLEGEKQGVLESNKNINSQENENDPTKVYVGGIPYYSTEDDIRSYFESCGTITEIDCMRFPESGKFRGIAIISFKTEAAAKRALALDGADMGGLFLKIQPYKTTRSSKTTNFAPKVVDGYNRIYVGNLSWDVTEDELRKLLLGLQYIIYTFWHGQGNWGIQRICPCRFL
ncbi:RNA-binding protein CP31B, chloroplastic-like [Quillaja saponaria]|uniref:RNA-binding protein CP31B, chloroplastic-like n=1 Tax=Quillaja saponaria TaxID=32244 RepID=A0AAD7Q6P6_QUISA|nr:RNA-binding protein CP31B, chloroplastic-like [Quillaja saponaria]